MKPDPPQRPTQHRMTEVEPHPTKKPTKPRSLRFVRIARATITMNPPHCFRLNVLHFSSHSSYLDHISDNLDLLQRSSKLLEPNYSQPFSTYGLLAVGHLVLLVARQTAIDFHVKISNGLYMSSFAPTDKQSLRYLL